MSRVRRDPYSFATSDRYAKAIEEKQESRARERARRKPKDERARTEEPPVDDRRLDEEQYPGEPTFVERLHGVTRPSAPPPQAIQKISDAWMRYEAAMERPSAYLRAKGERTLRRAREAKRKGRDVEAGVHFATFGLQRTMAGVWTGVTLPIRPLAMISTLKTGVALATSKETRALALQDVGLTFEFGGAMLGGVLVGSAITKGKQAYREYKTRRFEAKYPVEAFLPYEESARFPQTVTTDLPHDVDIKSKVPVLWELRGRRASIAISGRTRKGFTLLGHDVKPALIPEGFGKLQTIIERKVRYVPTYTHAPGIPIHAPIYTPPLPSPGLSPLILSGLATLRGPTGLERLDLDTKGQPKSIVDTVERLRERERGRAVTKRKVKTIPEEMVEQWVYTPEIIDVIAEEKVIAIPTAIPIVAPISRARMRTRQTQAIPIAMMAMPTIFSVAPPRMESPKLPPIRLRRGKKRGKDLFGFGIAGEMRGYPIKMPKDILKELGL